MSGSAERVARAFDRTGPDRTPLFELFCPYHPIHWSICGRTVATDQAAAWDAMADGIVWEELLEAHVRAEYEVRKFFGLDMVRLNGCPRKNYTRPVKVGRNRWTRNGIAYRLNERTRLIEPENPGQSMSYSRRFSEEEARRQIEEWTGVVPEAAFVPDPLLEGVKELARRDGVDWVYMAEINAGTGVAFYPPFLLMWIIDEPDLFRRWLEMKKEPEFARTRQLIRQGCSVIAIGGDVSCDKGPFISPEHYREFILPVIQEHVGIIHEQGAKAVYTSDGNHWPIKDEFFFDSGIDGYKEVDKAAGMTWPRLIQEGVADRICIIGNLDARFTLCQGTPEQVREEVFECLGYGRRALSSGHHRPDDAGRGPDRAAGGHILHASHSVHEDVKVENYHAAVNAYREYFGMEELPACPPSHGWA